jgi:hypothetical protein
MRLPNILKKIKEIPDMPKDIFILCVIFLVGIGSFLLGKYSANEEKRGVDLRITNTPLTSEQPATDEKTHSPSTRTLNIAQPTNSSAPGMYLGSRGGTTYHLPWCSGAKRIKEENKIWFLTKEDAVSKGYKPASNCKGI